jgi:hypothetical protein
MWHKRLRHIEEKGLRVLHGKGMVEHISNYSMGFYLCEHYIYGKQNQVTFPSGARRVDGILQLVHSDVFGLVSISSLENMCTMSHLYMASQGIHGFISSRRNLKSLKNSKSLSLLWIIRQRRELRCQGWIMVDNYTEMNSNNSIRSVV